MKASCVLGLDPWFTRALTHVLDGLEDRFLIHIDTLGFAEVLQGELVLAQADGRTT
jgi:hypothetical protein